MRIAYDAKRAFKNSTGLGNYSRSLIAAMTAYYPDNEYYLYAPDKKHLPQSGFLFQLKNAVIKNPALPFFTSYWRSKGVIKDLLRDKIDLYHGLSHEIPLGIEKTKIKSVVTIHDLIFLSYPALYPAIDRKIYTAKIANACKNANQIIAISEQTKRDIIDYLKIEEQKISVVYQGCHPVFYKTVTEKNKNLLREKWNLPSQFILNVGTIEERKNLLLILQALLKLPEEIKLIVVGKRTKYAEKTDDFIAENKLADRVIFLKDITQEELPALYQSALAFVYPSRFEGFGIPVLEALNSGVPVIAATGSSLEEAGGEHTIYINPDDADALAEAVLQVISNESLRKEMIAKGKEYASRFHEKEMAANLMKVYSQTLAK